jgi:hypothetical protein
MSKHQAILESLLGAAELNGNNTVASQIRSDIERNGNAPHAGGYQRLWVAAFSRRIRKAA